MPLNSTNNLFYDFIFTLSLIKIKCQIAIDNYAVLNKCLLLPLRQLK